MVTGRRHMGLTERDASFGGIICSECGWSLMSVEQSRQHAESHPDHSDNSDEQEASDRSVVVAPCRPCPDCIREHKEHCCWCGKPIDKHESNGKVTVFENA